ncbi:sensor histidine kinase [Niabella ginsengisoli]|uniref:histidine kinase n=1 Tax=Niabella ginsengisoli TaxID=522298 RepID=A0ABS9SP82_9BACT|nr:ATP-binding protein [Niabella ginsengisoli]MCH5600162.1 ATP-binding protein [Niabella ginsengisoli]
MENERLVRDQNITLERQVHERTQELEKSNDNLNNTLSQLKSAQSKLVESEKMVSLGQLTAGIAHEINNPINFVTSNVKPLELDITDLLTVIKKYEEIDTSKNVDDQLSSIEEYKKQIDINYINEEIRTLLSGIKDGAHRTAEIVSNLKNFARIDEANVKFVNLNRGLQSTLLLVKNSFPRDFILNKEFGDIPDVECTAGKINQVFMNIITNGLQSIEERQATNPGVGILSIKTFEEDGKVKVSIKDNGTGIEENIREKIFEPFYTTKPVGQGTGLGMSIVKGIIDSHNGTIEVISNFGDGAEFIITLPINYLN